MNHRLALLALLLSSALVVPAVAPAHQVRERASGISEFRVEAGIGLHPEIDLSVDVSADVDPPGRITIYVPHGFQIDPARSAGSTVGTAEVVAEDNSYGTPSRSVLPGNIVAQAPTRGGGCVSGRIVGRWTLELSLLGQPLDVPIYVLPAGRGDPAGTVTKLVLCAPQLPGPGSTTSRALPIGALELALQQLERPHDQRSYLWRAEITPLTPDRRALRPARTTYELQALVGSQRLTLNGRYDGRSRRVLLAGRLTGSGPRGGVKVQIVELIRKITANGVVNLDHTVGSATTGGDGSYALAVPAGKTGGYVAILVPGRTACHSRAFAPAGCRSSTRSEVESEPITISVVAPTTTD